MTIKASLITLQFQLHKSSWFYSDWRAILRQSTLGYPGAPDSSMLLANAVRHREPAAGYLT
jgi:hypothetical protein